MKMTNPRRPLSCLLLTLWLGAGCASRSPTEQQAQGPDLATHHNDLGSSDLASPADLAQQQMPDLIGGVCAGHGGQRLCDNASNMSASCDGDLVYHTDQVCTGSGCSSGHCDPPQGAARCTSDSSCGGDNAALSCQLFTNIFDSYSQLCAPPAGSGKSLESCQQPSDCRWNICYPFPDGSRCLKPCARDADCDGSVGSCGPATVSIEGLHDTILGCAR